MITIFDFYFKYHLFFLYQVIICLFFNRLIIALFLGLFVIRIFRCIGGRIFLLLMMYDVDCSIWIFKDGKIILFLLFVLAQMASFNKVKLSLKNDDQVLRIIRIMTYCNFIYFIIIIIKKVVFYKQISNFIINNA